MPLARINDIDLYYELSGEGEPLVFIPGLGGTTELWTFQTRQFSQTHRTLTLDNRGAGRSDKPEGAYAMETFARDLHDLLDHLGITEPITLVGASMGGIISQAFIHDYPQRVKKLVLVCSGVSGGDPHITLPAMEVMQKLAAPGDTLEAKTDTLLSIFYHPDFIARNPQIRQYYLSRQDAPQPPHAYQAQLAACGDPRPYYEWLADIRVPTLIIHGTHDQVWPLQNAHTLKAGIGEHAQLSIMENAGHVLMAEQVAEFNRILAEFVA